MSEEPTLLDTYIKELRQQKVEEEKIALLSVVAKVWIDVLRKNPRRLSSEEITLITMRRIEGAFLAHLDPLWTPLIDPDQGFGRMGRGMRPMLI
jgi:hypothetical protein